jgi:hypothetical protein
MKKTNILIFVMMFLMLSVFGFAQPPFKDDPILRLDSPLFIEVVEVENHPINTSFYLHTHIYSNSNGLIKDPIADSIICDYHLYSEKANWEHVDIGNLSAYGDGLFTYLNESLFQEEDEFALLLWCECDGCISDRPDDKVGGFTRFKFSVGGVDEEKLSNLFYPSLIIVFVLIFIGFSFKQPIIGIIGSLGLTLTGFMLSGFSLGLTVVAGIIFSLLFLLVD